MFSERGKTALILFLAVSALSIEILPDLLFLFCESNFADPLFDIIGRPDWLWLPGIGIGWVYIAALVLAASAIVGTLAWKPDSLALFIFVILVEVIVIIYAVYWAFMIYVATHLSP